MKHLRTKGLTMNEASGMFAFLTTFVTGFNAYGNDFTKSFYA